jgi:hypothetical protein
VSRPAPAEHVAAVVMLRRLVAAIDRQPKASSLDGLAEDAKTLLARLEAPELTFKVQRSPHPGGGWEVIDTRDNSLHGAYRTPFDAAQRADRLDPARDRSRDEGCRS